jgi:hypothetical protein
MKEWSLLLTCSIVTLCSLLSVLSDRKDDGWDRHEKWAVSVASISLSFAFFGCLASMLPEATALKVESPLVRITIEEVRFRSMQYSHFRYFFSPQITICLGFWAAGMPAILDPDHSLAVYPGFGIANANLYFFSWGALISSILLAGSWGKEANGDKASKTAVQWVCLLASSLVVMGTSSSIFNDTGCKSLDLDTDRCNRTKFAIGLGLASGVLALVMLPFKHAPMICHMVMGLLLLCSWCCGVAFITFGDGPGINLGNVYFATWISLFLCLNITTTAFKEMRSEKADKEDEPGAEQAAKPEDNESSDDKEEVAAEEGAQDVERGDDVAKAAKAGVSI